MNKPDIATIIDLHFEELTELEQEIARYFYKLKRSKMISLLSKLPRNYISPKQP